MGFRYPQPDNEHDFEELCLRLYRKLWKNESLKLYAKRGERQDGVDIFDPLCIAPVRAVQCKHHESTKPLRPSEIETEVAKAEHFQFPIDRYVIATTAKKSRKAQDTVAELNLRRDRKFTVDIVFWEDICQQASELGRVVAELIIYGENILAGAAADEQRSTVWSSISSSPVESLDSQEPYRTIEDLLNDRRLDLARHELDKLPDTKTAESLPLTDRYKLLRLRAKLALEEGNFEAAAELFLKAYAVAPELDQAKQNQVLAFSLLGDTKQAYARATEYISAGLKTPVMVLRLLDSITSQDQLTQHASLFEALLHTDENINTVLSHKYMWFDDYAHAYEAATRALTITTDSPHAHLAAALAMHNEAVYGDRDQRLHRLQVALTHYDSALSAARQQRFKGLPPEILVNRAAAKMLLGDTHGAARDYRAAVDSATRPSVYAGRAMGFFLQEQDFGSARELLDSMDRGSREARYLALVSNYETADLPEKRTSIDDMALLAEQQWDRARECRFHCVQWALELGEPELAESFVSTAFQEEHPFQAHTMLAWIRISSQDEARAKEEALRALDESIQSAHPQELRVLAYLLVRLGEDEHALGLLEQVSRPGVLDDEMKSLITCAQRLGRDDLLLRLCRELRDSGAQDENLRRLELQLLNQYAPEEAFELADEFIQNSDRPSYFVAFRNLLAYDSGVQKMLLLIQPSSLGQRSYLQRKCRLLSYRM